MAPSPLMLLPLEVRTIIYNYVFEDVPRSKMITSGYQLLLAECHDDGSWTTRYFSESALTWLPLVNRQIRFETLPMMWNKITVHLPQVASIFRLCEAPSPTQKALAANAMEVQINNSTLREDHPFLGVGAFDPRGRITASMFHRLERVKIALYTRDAAWNSLYEVRSESQVERMRARITTENGFVDFFGLGARIKDVQIEESSTFDSSGRYVSLSRSATVM